MNKNKIIASVLSAIFIFSIFFNISEAGWFPRSLICKLFPQKGVKSEIGFIGESGYIRKESFSNCGRSIDFPNNFKNKFEGSIFRLNNGKIVKSRLIPKSFINFKNSQTPPYKAKITIISNFIKSGLFNESFTISEEEKKFNNPLDIIDRNNIEKTSSSEDCGWLSCETTTTYEITSYVITAYGNIYRGHSVQSQTTEDSWLGDFASWVGIGTGTSFNDSGMNWELVYEPDYLPKIDLKVNNVDYDIMMTVPDTTVNLNWMSSNADSCVASGDWKGKKQLNGNEFLGKLQRGMKNPGKGKIYNYSLSCRNDYGEVFDSVSVKIMQYPVCSFYSEPPEIILPQKSNLYWNCSYADSCKIDQKIGSINTTSGLMQVRPQQNTVYNLNCSGIDGDKSLYTNVNIKEPSINNKIWRIREVAPR